MPLYEYKCDHCQSTWATVKKIKERDTMNCPLCHRLATRKLSLPAKGVCILEPYYDNGIGAMVTGPKQKRELLKSRNLEPI